ncbi:SRPBCC family protein [Lusitaniella coriacea LEGE 07157]|uniref:SRPBCC family protein n=1 Tax=Lusitaniella coriacea LEGE 07157 TaxID=945747 RepID=A0A8J7E5H1_9CYAN|nr:SRPBCC family protein [Lusitaniella coriacea]MBE9118649.1 SRPBCC family protein [Lusitaniella coriacea LEGE 07157]
MLHFQYSSIIRAPVEVVWAFHERPDILQVLTPPWQPVRVLRREGGLEVGAISAFQLFLGPLPIEWVARHTEYDRGRLFVDEQIKGPMDSWVHRHQFIPEGSTTRLTDSIDYAIPGGWLAEFLLGWWVDSRLREMFRYRHEVTQRECES